MHNTTLQERLLGFGRNREEIGSPLAVRASLEVTWTGHGNRKHTKNPIPRHDCRGLVQAWCRITLGIAAVLLTSAAAQVMAESGAVPSM